ncbi:prolyl-tRNA synthetase associated domain-containing protein [Geminicoccus roseus]|uniref:prolyl-tRNA synthetase associated domain-containing protein n=1 Tax=Geminicoccus roseus TaxID=404900 RepID=UPI00041158A4|nr:prolyl-tRNA synthetase associated domain-containing protein [Geminicoccus roseus]
MSARDKLMGLLAELGIVVRTEEHPPVYTVEEAQAHTAHLPGGHCKNLFLKDKKGELYLVVCLDDQQVRVNALSKRLGAGRMSFGNEELLLATLGVTPGSVTPFALINDVERKVRPVLDAKMLRHEILNYHPLTNEATVSIGSSELTRLLAHWGYEPIILDLDELLEEPAA